MTSTSKYRPTFDIYTSKYRSAFDIDIKIQYGVLQDYDIRIFSIGTKLFKVE